MSKEAFFVVMSLDREGRRDIVGVYNNPTEGSGIWGECFEDLKSRGLRDVGLIISDGLNNIEEVAREHFTGVDVQLCTVHLQREITRKIRPRDKSAISSDLQEVFSKDALRSSPLEGLESFRAFADRWSKSYPFLTKIANGRRIEYYFTYLKYDVSIRKYIYSTNWIERFNRQIKKSARYKCALQVRATERGIGTTPHRQHRNKCDLFAEENRRADSRTTKDKQEVNNNDALSFPTQSYHPKRIRQGVISAMLRQPCLYSLSGYL